MLKLTKENIDAEIKQSNKQAIIDVYADWCGPCQQMKPIFEELSEQLGDKYIFAEINVDDARDLAIEYGVTSVPTFVFIKENEVKGKETGYMSQDELKKKIEDYLG